MTEVKDLVESVIANNKVVIFSKSWCPYSIRAKKLFADEYKEEKPKILELDSLEEESAIQDYLKDKTGQRSVPNIFINQEHIGGCDDTMAAHGSGKLRQLLAA